MFRGKALTAWGHMTKYGRKSRAAICFSIAIPRVVPSARRDGARRAFQIR